MASLSPPSILPSPSSSLHRRSTSTRLLSLRTCALSPSTARRWSQLRRLSAVRAQTFDFSASFFEGGFDGPEDDDDGLISPSGPGGTALAEEDKPEIPCPPGLRRYETMAVLRPDMTEDERLALTQKYEELLVSGGGMYVEVYNRGVASRRRTKQVRPTRTWTASISSSPTSLSPSPWLLSMPHSRQTMMSSGHLASRLGRGNTTSLFQIFNGVILFFLVFLKSKEITVEENFNSVLILSHHLPSIF